MARAGWSMAALAFVATLLSALIPLLGTFIIAPLASIIIGAGAGWWASKRLGSGGAGRGAGAGSIAGLGAFLGSTIGTIIIFSILGNTPEFQQQIQTAWRDAQQQSPDAQLPALDSATLTGAAGVIGGVSGFCMGLIDIFLSMIGGLIAGLVYGRRDTPVAAPVGGYVPAENTGLPQMSSQTPYSTQQNYGTQQDYGTQQNYGTQQDYNTRVLDPQPNDTDDDHKARIYPDTDDRPPTTDDRR